MDTHRRLADRYRPPAADDPMVTDSGGGGENPWLPQDRKLHVADACQLMHGCPGTSFDYAMGLLQDTSLVAAKPL